jgi:hypothetical protein
VVSFTRRPVGNGVPIVACCPDPLTGVIVPGPPPQLTTT